MEIFISSKIVDKLSEKHNVKEEDIAECFCNRDGKFLKDIRSEHKTEPITQWFIAETDRGVNLKVCFMQTKDGDIYIKTAYEPNEKEKRIYEKFGRI